MRKSLEHYCLSAGLQIIYWSIKNGGRRKFLSHFSRVFKSAYNGNVNHIRVRSLKYLKQIEYAPKSYNFLHFH